MNFEIGQSLTYDQAKQLPDGAMWEMTRKHSGRTMQFTAPLQTYMNSNDEDPSVIKWRVGRYDWDSRWRSHKLIYLPPTTQRTIRCDKCGTTYKGGERHSCAQLQVDPPGPCSDSVEAASVWLASLTPRGKGAKEHAEACRKYLRACDYAASVGAISKDISEHDEYERLRTSMSEVLDRVRSAQDAATAVLVRRQIDGGYDINDIRIKMEPEPLVREGDKYFVSYTLRAEVIPQRVKSRSMAGPHQAGVSYPELIQEMYASRDGRLFSILRDVDSTPDRMGEIERSVRSEPLRQRISKAIALLNDMTARRRPPKISLPPSDSDEDIFIRLTLLDCLELTSDVTPAKVVDENRRD